MWYRIKRFLKQTYKVARLDDPRPALFLFWPCVWGVFFAKGGASVSVFPRLFLFGVACLLMYVFGCITNDVVDREIDAKIPRTKERLLASGRYSIGVALFIAMLCGLLSLRILLIFNKFTISVGVFGVIVAAIYPFVKRVTHYVVFVLGIAANIGVLVGYSSLSGFVSKSSILMYIGGIYWTAIYDSIYGCQDREFDIQIGVKSLPVLYGSNLRARLKSYVVMMLFCMSLAGLVDRYTMNFGYYIVLWLGIALVWKTVATTDFENKKSCYAALATNSMIGGIIGVACYIGAAR